MRRLCLLALLAAPAFPSACTLSASYTLSASSGHWTGGCPTIPGNGDTVTIAEGVTLNVNQNWTIGASGANNTTPAIYDGVTGLVKVNAGVALTLRGDFLWTRGSPYYNSGLTMDAGSALVFDASQASSPTTTRYRIGDNESIYGSRWLAANGTSASHVAITSVNTNGALNGQFRSGLNAVGAAAGYGGCDLQVAYADFSNIGDMATYGEAFAPREYSTESGTCTVTNSTFNNVGPWLNANLDFSSNETVNIGNNVWTNSPCASATYGCFPVTNEAPSAGSYLFQNNVFDFCIGLEYNQYAMDFSGSYLGNGSCQGGIGSSIALSNLFVHQSGDVGTNPFVTYSTALNGGYFLLDRIQDNPHWTQGGNGAGSTVTGWIYDEPDNVTTDSGEIDNYGCSGTCSVVMQNSIHVPSKTGLGTSEFASFTNAAPNNAGMSFSQLHDTWVGATSVGAFGQQQTNESGAQLIPATALKSNLDWSNGGGYCKVGTVQTASMYQNPVTIADYNYADQNAIRSFGLSCSDGTCPNGTICPNSGNSYFGKWSATPGTHDVDVLHPTVLSPYLADPTRNLAGWDTAYLGHALGAQWTSGLGTVAYGAIVSDANASYWGVYKGGVNYRCIVLTGCITSTANTEPLVGTNWRTQWEFASLYDIRQAIGSGSTFVDGALPGCTAATPCVPVQALVAWVQRGMTPQAPALWCAGHDGETVGAVPFCAVGKLQLGVMAGI